MERLTYTQAGVDRNLRAKGKKHLETLKSTYKLSMYGPVIETPFNTLYPIGNGRYQVKVMDGVGTKVLLSELADKHDTIGIDAVAMVANDCIRCGAQPLAITDAIDVKKSYPELLGEIIKGLKRGAMQAGCPLIGGEIADVPEIMNALYHINCDCVGEVKKEKIITGKRIKSGNVVIGLRSSGAHSNGISLLRKVLFKKWGGKYEAFEKLDGFEKELIYVVLEPTRIYVKPFLKVAKEYEIKGAIHITGDAYLKFDKLIEFSKGIGFELDNFEPQPIFQLIQSTAKDLGSPITDEEFLKTFNAGWGFAVICEQEVKDDVISDLEKNKIKAEQIGKVTDSGKIVAVYNNRKIELK